MKIIHTADWHIGQNFFNHDRKEEHQNFFRQLRDIISKEKPDALLICGDVFDNGLPSSAARKLYTEELVNIHETLPQMQIVVIAGNHDSSSYLESDNQVWKLANVALVGRNTKPEDQIVKIRNVGYVAAIPFSYPQNYPDLTGNTPREERPKWFIQAVLDRISEINDGQLPVVMMAHQTVKESDFSEKMDAIGNIAGVSIEDLGHGYDYLALGHIHKNQTMCGSDSSMAAYSGSPLPISFSEENYQHGVNMVEIDAHGGEVKITTIPLNLIRGMKTYPDQLLPIKDVLNLLKKLPDDDNSYLRVRVLEDSTLDIQAVTKVREVLKNKSYRFCRLLSERPKGIIKKTESSMSVDEIQEADPVDIAGRFYKSKYGMEMPQDHVSMMKDVWEEVTTHDEPLPDFPESREEADAL